MRFGDVGDFKFFVLDGGKCLKIPKLLIQVNATYWKTGLHTEINAVRYGTLPGYESWNGCSMVAEDEEVEASDD